GAGRGRSGARGPGTPASAPHSPAMAIIADTLPEGKLPGAGTDVATPGRKRRMLPLFACRQCEDPRSDAGNSCHLGPGPDPGERSALAQIPRLRLGMTG